MTQTIVIGPEEALGELKEVEAWVVEPELVTACPNCGCKRFNYRLRSGVGIKRYCYVCNRRVKFREY